MMNFFTKRFLRKPDNTPADCYIQQEIFLTLRNLSEKTLPIVLFLGAMALAATFVQHLVGKGSYFVLFLSVALYLMIVAVTVWHRRLSSLQVFTIFLTCIYAVALAGLLNRGLAGTGIIHLTFFCIFSGLYLGFSTGMAILSVSAITATVIGWCIITGVWETKADSSIYLLHPINWTIHIICLIMYMIPLILMANGLRRRTAQTQWELRENNRRLEAEIAIRQATETALIESEEKYRNVVESPLAGFFILQNTSLTFVNGRCRDITGYKQDELMVMNALEPIHPDDRKLVRENVAECLAAKGNVVQFDARIMQKQGDIITARIFISSTQYNNEEAISGTFIDITREKILESQLRQAQKMEAIGQLAGGIAHDFNNILTAFNGYGSILQIKMPKEDPLRIYVDQILSAAQKASSLTQNLLTFSRQQPINLIPLDINSTILGTEKLLRRLLTEDIHFTVRLSQDTVTVLADETQIDQILFNLVCNARDAMPQGGRLHLETGAVVLNDDFRRLNGFGKSGPYVCISLSDTGIGMDRATKEKIFDPFFTTKEMGRGTGLGLATVYGIVKQHNGYIIAQSEPRQGSVFDIYLPAIHAEIETEAINPMVLKKGWETILVAEDDDVVRAFIKDTFDMTGYKTIEAVDGEDAIKKFRETDPIHMVILDSVMPKKNGREVFEVISKMAANPKVLFISGYTHDIILDKGIRDKELQFLAKPLKPDILLEKVRSILDSQP